MKKPIAGEERLLLESYGRKVMVQDFVLPNGERTEFLFLKSNHGNPVIILPLTADNRVIALKQFRFPVNDFVMECPGGRVEKSQTSDEAVVRELLEETGYRPGKLILLNGGCWMDPGTLRASFIPYLALDCRKEKEPEHDATEIIEVSLLDWEEWCKMIYDPASAVDSKSMVLTLLALPHLKGLRLKYDQK